MNKTIIMFALIDYIQSFKAYGIDSPLKYEAIDELIRINDKVKIEGGAYIIDVFKEIGFNSVQKRNYYAHKGR